MTDVSESLAVRREMRAGRGRYFVADAKGNEAQVTFTVLSATLASADATRVDEALRGTGVAVAIIEQMVRDARVAGMRIVPNCPYVNKQRKRHPEWSDAFAPRGLRVGERLRPGMHMPPVEFARTAGGDWTIDADKSGRFTALFVYRGQHCSFCREELEGLASLLDDFARLEIRVAAVSMDDEARASRSAAEWKIDGLTLCHGLDEEVAKGLGLFLSPKLKPAEPPMFSEPAMFLVKPDLEIQALLYSTAPWLRVDAKAFLRGVALTIQRNTPPRGTA